METLVNRQQYVLMNYQLCSDNPEKNTFDHLVFNSVNNGLIRSGARHRALTQTVGNTRGSTSTRPEVRKITFKICDFIDISNAVIPTAFGGSTTTSPSIVIVIL
jgi:hypothetical protein